MCVNPFIQSITYTSYRSGDLNLFSVSFRKVQRSLDNFLTSLCNFVSVSQKAFHSPAVSYSLFAACNLEFNCSAVVKKLDLRFGFR